jgi:hypothetical protein
MAKTVQRSCRIAEAELNRMAMPMLDRRRTRQVFLFLGNMAFGILTGVVTFFGLVWIWDSGSFAALFLLIAVPALGLRGWRAGVERRGREREQAARVAWQAFWVLIAWEAVAVVLSAFFFFIAFSAMAPVPHSHNTAGVIALIVILTLAVLVMWFTWVMSRRMLDLLWPLPGMPQRDSESTYLPIKL